MHNVMYSNLLCRGLEGGSAGRRGGSVGRQCAAIRRRCGAVCDVSGRCLVRRRRRGRSRARRLRGGCRLGRRCRRCEALPWKYRGGHTKPRTLERLN